MPDPQRLTAAHADAVLAFERANRRFFARTVSDRGDAWFERFDEGYAELLADQESGECAFYVLVEGEEVVGRVNLYDLSEGSATLGYRIAEHVTGRGVATAAVETLCRRAVDDHGVHTLRAASADTNVASQRVLQKSGFHPVRPTGPTELGGKPGRWWERDLRRLT